MTSFGIFVNLAEENINFLFQGQYDIRSILRHASSKEKESHPGSIKLVITTESQTILCSLTLCHFLFKIFLKTWFTNVGILCFKLFMKMFITTQIYSL